VFGCVDEADAMSFILQESHAGFLGFQDSPATFLAQVDIQFAMLGNQAHQRLRSVDIELINHKDPSSIWIHIDCALDMLSKICFCAGSSDGRRNAFARSYFQIGNQSLGAMSDVFMFIECDLTGFHGFGWMFSLKCLNAGLLIRTDQMCSLLIQLNYRVRQLLDEAKSAARERVYEHRLEHTHQLHKAGQVLKLFTDDTIAASTPFEEVRARAFAIIQRENLEQVADHILQTARWDEKQFQWEYVDQISNRYKLRLRPILRILDFEAATSNHPLIPALRFLKTALQQEKPLTQYKADKIPCRFIPNTSSRYLYVKTPQGEKQLLVDRYEFLVYRSLRNELQSGDIFCQNSVRFRSFEDDLLSDNQWREKDKLIDKVGLPTLTQAAEDHLAELSSLLEMRLGHVNQRIASGENEHIEVKKRGRWRLPYSRAGSGMNNPFFESLKQVDIHAVFHFVNRQCQFMSEFTHVLHRYAGRKADHRTLTACILAWGTNMGLGRMAQISDIGYQALTTASNNFIRLETLQKANASVANAIAQLPIFQQYNLEGVIHSSSDGQKFETLLHTINARYSPKYFGVMKGIVAYTLIANHIPINAKIIGANEHESHYVFDLLCNNLTDFQPNVHSTDSHGANEVNFGILNFFGYRFAPRYRDIYSKVNKALYGFMHPSQYDPDWLLRPIRKINKKLIIEEWENIQRIVVSLALKTTTQSIVIGKLSSYARKNRTKRALWEYDNIIRSLYLLDYIDSLSLRRNVQHALNQGESYHKLHKAVSYANFGRLRFKQRVNSKFGMTAAVSLLTVLSITTH